MRLGHSHALDSYTRGPSLRAPSVRSHASHSMPPLSRRELKKLVRQLGADARPSQQRHALETIASLCINPTGDGIHDTRAAVATAGAIVPLIQLLGAGYPADVQGRAAWALTGLARYDAAIVAAAGAIPPLVQLLGAGSSADVQEGAADALWNLALNNDNKVSIAAAGAIPKLVQLLGSCSSAGVQEIAAEALWLLAMNADNAVIISAAGAIPPLVQLLGAGSSAGVQQMAAGALEVLADSSDDIRAAIDAAEASANVLQEMKALGLN
jgi:hypothetical protein